MKRRLRWIRGGEVQWLNTRALAGGGLDSKPEVTTSCIIRRKFLSLRILSFLIDKMEIEIASSPCVCPGN